jgi:hypothetical protein
MKLDPGETIRPSPTSGPRPSNAPLRKGTLSSPLPHQQLGPTCQLTRSSPSSSRFYRRRRPAIKCLPRLNSRLMPARFVPVPNLQIAPAVLSLSPFASLLEPQWRLRNPSLEFAVSASISGQIRRRRWTPRLPFPPLSLIFLWRSSLTISLHHISSEKCNRPWPEGHRHPHRLQSPVTFITGWIRRPRSSSWARRLLPRVVVNFIIAGGHQNLTGINPLAGISPVTRRKPSPTVSLPQIHFDPLDLDRTPLKESLTEGVSFDLIHQIHFRSNALEAWS